jgi:hypothetical protein
MMDKSSGTKLSRTPDGEIPSAKSSAELFGWRAGEKSSDF